MLFHVRPDGEGYVQAVQSSPDVPALVIGGDTPAEARGHLYEQLLRQHVVAVGAE